MLNRSKTYSLEEREISSHTAASHKSTRNEEISSNVTIGKNHSNVTFKPFLGILYTFFHAVFGQLISVIAKKLWYVSICQLSVIRFTGVFLFSLPLVTFYVENVMGDERSRGLLIVRAIFGATALVLKLTAYRYLQLIEASVATSILPFVTAVLARIMLKERFGVVQSICLVVTVCGVMLSVGLPDILVPNDNFHFNVNHLIGYTCALGFILCVSLSIIFTRKLKETHFAVVMIYTGFIGTVENSVINATIYTFNITNCGWDHFLYTVVALFGFGSNCMMTLASQHEPAGLVTVQMSSFEILVIAVFQIIFFHKYPNWYTTIGACFVLISLTILGIQRWIQILPVTSETRRKLEWILT